MWQPLGDGNVLLQCRNGTKPLKTTLAVKPCKLLSDVMDNGCRATAAAADTC